MKRICLKHAIGFIHRRGGQILYYTGVALALSLIACAAQGLRSERNAEIPPHVLPASVAGETEQVSPHTEFRLPEQYVVLRNYNASPAWNTYLGCWQSHPAADFGAEDSLVRSICAGQVRSTGNDGLHGGYIEVETGNYRVLYGSVESLKTAGDQIEAGEIIGRMNVSMPGEENLQQHVHIEIMRNGRSQNPVQLMKNTEQGT